MDVAVLLDVRPALQADMAPWHLATAIRARRAMSDTRHPVLVLQVVINLSATSVPSDTTRWMAARAARRAVSDIPHLVLELLVLLLQHATYAMLAM